MNLNEFLTEAISKRLKIPKEIVTREFMENYYKEHSKELRHLENDFATRYLKHINSDEEYKEKLVKEEQQFLKNLQ
jgi:hypothetical protein